MWAVDRADANKNCCSKQRRKLPSKVTNGVVERCSKGVRPFVILDEGTVGHAVYIEKVLPAVLKYGNEVFGSAWIFQ